MRHQAPVEQWDGKLDAPLWIRIVLGVLTVLMFVVLGTGLALFLEGVAK